VDLIDMAVEDKVIEKSGAWISYGEMRLGQGRENAKNTCAKPRSHGRDHAQGAREARAGY